MIFYEPGRHRDAGLAHDPFKALVAPRPIGWVSTMSDDGRVTLAPHSFFNAVGETPPMLAFSSSGAKHSATFAGALREFVWNLVTFELREKMNFELHDIDGPPVDQHLVVGQVGGVHLDESAIADGTVDTARLRPVARLGGPADHTVVDDVFRMKRPSE